MGLCTESCKNILCNLHETARELSALCDRFSVDKICIRCYIIDSRQSI